MLPDKTKPEETGCTVEEIKEEEKIHEEIQHPNKIPGGSLF